MRSHIWFYSVYALALCAGMGAIRAIACALQWPSVQSALQHNDLSGFDVGAD